MIIGYYMSILTEQERGYACKLAKKMLYIDSSLWCVYVQYDYYIIRIY